MGLASYIDFPNVNYIYRLTACTQGDNDGLAVTLYSGPVPGLIECNCQTNHHPLALYINANLTSNLSREAHQRVQGEAVLGSWQVTRNTTHINFYLRAKQT